MLARMELTTQAEAYGVTEIGAGDRANFWRVPRHDRLECLAATFRTHRYAPHSHETYVIGVITAGCEGYRLRGEHRIAPAGTICFVNPGEVHDGAPVGAGYAYRMIYPSTALIAGLAEEHGDGPVRTLPFFPEPVVSDPALAALFLAAHWGLEGPGSALAADERLVAALGLLVSRHSDLGRGSAGPSVDRRIVDRARDFLDAHLADDIDLATLSAAVGIGRTQLIRMFRGATGLTPHAWLTDRRVRAAQALLRAGESPGQVAAATGFFDQAHLTRAFKARLGVTPGVFRTGLAA